jgi:hypothetical protein
MANLKLKREAHNALRQPAVVTWAVGFVAILAAYVLVQGRHIGLELFYTPWHPDDFAMLSGAGTVSLLNPRPVSGNIFIFFGRLGAAGFYSVFTAIWIVAMTATSVFANRVFGLRPSPWLSLIFAFAGSAIWYATAPSIQSLQYLGLITNSISLMFGFFAALVFLQLGQLQFGSNRYIATALLFTLLVVLAAFAKEDMIAFLMLVAVGSDCLIKSQNRRRTPVLGVVIVAVCYIASAAHGKLVGSPITAGVGPYDISHLPHNLVENFAFYLTASPATSVLLGLFTAAAALFGTLSVWRPTLRQAFKFSLFILLCALALLAPYLILPRHFDFYAMNFVPLIAFSFAPLALKFGRTATGAVVLAVFCLLFFVDRSSRNTAMAWMQRVRERSLVQIQGIKRAVDLGLRDCSSVSVTGVDDSLGPFLSGPAYVSTLIGKNINWSIQAKPGSLLDRNHPARVSANWKYSPAIETSDCRLDFDLKVSRATFTDSLPPENRN